MTVHREIVQDYIFNTLQISNDLYRNASDSEFVKSGGEIVYCFDSNVFNLFYNTYKWRAAVSSFHSRNFAGSDDWAAIEAQSALIAAEYLLSEELPGASGGNVYLSPWHLSELSQNLDRITEDFFRGLQNDSDQRKRILVEANRKLRVVSLFKNESALERKGSNALHNDLRTLSNFIGNDSVRLRRFALTRYAAEVLVSCKLTERMDQIRRIVSRPLRNRLKSLEDFTEIDETARRHLYDDARLWYSRLEKEENLGEQDHKGPRRTGQAKWNDAQTTAFVRWVSLKIPPHQRLVFVTGDDVLFNTYRRWWVSGATDPGDEPFIMRRTVQYAPIFNLSDARSDVSVSEEITGNVEKLFEDIQAAIETSLLPFNLSMIAKDEDRKRLNGSIMRGREFLALRARDSRTQRGRPDLVMSYFLAGKKDEWFSEQAKNLGEIKELFRRIERIGIGLFHDMVLRRLEDDAFLNGMTASGFDGTETNDEVEQYLEKSLDALSHKVRSAWLPSALEFLNSSSRRNPGANDRRVPDSLSYTLLDEPVYTFIKRPHEEITQSGAMVWDNRPEAVFVVAAVVAMDTREWWKAEEFASQALIAVLRGTGDVDLLAEVRFLHAQTKRFRFGASETTAHANSDGYVGRKAKLRLDADFILSQLENEYEAGETALSRLHWWRAKAERTSLSLFALIDQLGVLEAGAESAHLAGEVEEITKALENCAQFHRQSKAIFEQYPVAAEAIWQQVQHNICTLHAARFVMEPGIDFRSDPRFDFVRDDLKIYTGSRISKSIRYQAIFMRIVEGMETPVTELALELGGDVEGELHVDRSLRRMLADKKGVIYDIHNMRSLRAAFSGR
jgi:hypothetical protein